MSDLKYQSWDVLKRMEISTNKYIEKLESQIQHKKQKVSGQRERLKWIRHYIKEKEPKETKYWVRVLLEVQKIVSSEMFSEIIEILNQGESKHLRIENDPFRRNNPKFQFSYGLRCEKRVFLWIDEGKWLTFIQE